LEEERKLLPKRAKEHSAKHDIRRTLTQEFEHGKQVDKEPCKFKTFYDKYKKEEELYGYGNNKYEEEARDAAERQAEINMDRKVTEANLSDFNIYNDVNYNNKYEPDYEIMKEYSENPTTIKGNMEKGKCEDAASCIVYDAKKKGVSDDKIQVLGVKAKNYKKGGMSSHVITNVDGKIYDPTKTQFGYENPELITDDLDENYSKEDIQVLPTKTYKIHGAKLYNKNINMDNQSRNFMFKKKKEMDMDDYPSVDDPEFREEEEYN